MKVPDKKKKGCIVFRELRSHAISGKRPMSLGKDYAFKLRVGVKIKCTTTIYYITALARTY